MEFTITANVLKTFKTFAIIYKLEVEKGKNRKEVICLEIMAKKVVKLTDDEKYEKAFPEPEENKRVFVPVMSGAVPEDPVKLAKTVKNSRVKSEGKDSQPKKTDGNSVHEKKAAGRKTAGKPAPGKKRMTGK